MADDAIRVGGLLPCCINSLWEREKAGSEGEVARCRTCEVPAQFRGGAWEWASDLPLRQDQPQNPASHL